MNTCKLTSSVKIAWPASAGPEPYILVDMCVVDGFNLLNRKRAWLPPWSHTTYRGIGNRSANKSCNGLIDQSTITCLGDKSADKGEAPHLRIFARLLEKLFEIFVRLLLVISRLAPLRDCLAVEDEDMKERVQEEDDIRFDGDTIEEHRLRCCLIECI